MRGSSTNSSHLVTTFPHPRVALSRNSRLSNSRATDTSVRQVYAVTQVRSDQLLLRSSGLLTVLFDVSVPRINF